MGTKKSYDVIVVGGGAAGMMAAYAAACCGRQVLVAERNERLGRKLLITGKGRCNVTNNCTPQELMQHVQRNPKFLYSAFSQFTAQDTMEFFERLHVPLKTERGNRVFPQSDRASDIVAALSRAVRDVGCDVVTARVTSLCLHDGCVSGVETSGGVFATPAVIVATGGLSYPATGSTGDGYRLAKQAGHTIVPPAPSLVPLEIEGGECAEMMGLSLRNVLLTLEDTQTGKALYREQGELLMTHFGMSGPLVLSASSHIPVMQRARYRIHLDLKPALEPSVLDARVLRDFGENLNRAFHNSLGRLLPRAVIPVIIKRSGIDPQLRVHQISREMRARLCARIKDLDFAVKSFRPVEEAIITSGGVSTSEITPKTMASKLVRGLYFAGEVIDVDAYTGGFNLQIAFSTGYAAGTDAGSWSQEE